MAWGANLSDKQTGWARTRLAAGAQGRRFFMRSRL